MYYLLICLSYFPYKSKGDRISGTMSTAVDACLCHSKTKSCNIKQNICKSQNRKKKETQTMKLHRTQLFANRNVVKLHKRSNSQSIESYTSFLCHVSAHHSPISLCRCCSACESLFAAAHTYHLRTTSPHVTQININHYFSLCVVRI